MPRRMYITPAITYETGELLDYCIPNFGATNLLACSTSQKFPFTTLYTSHALN